MKKSHKILIGILLVIIFGLLARYVLFVDKFEEWGDNFERIGAWEEEYRTDNPNATDKEVDAAFKAGIANITIWIEQYKQDNPGATDEEARAAFEAQWSN